MTDEPPTPKPARDRRKTNALPDRRQSHLENRPFSPQVAQTVADVPATTIRDEHVTDQLLHELQVHQIELEIQNEELRRTQVALEEARDQYVSLFEFAPVGYVILSASGLIKAVNFNAARLLGAERKKLLSRPLSRFIAQEHADQYILTLSRLLNRQFKQTIAFKLKREDGEVCYVHADFMQMESDTGEITLRVTLTDITKQKLAEQALSIAATAFEVHEGIVIMDANGVAIRVNQSFSQMTGYDADEVVGHPLFFLQGQQSSPYFFDNIKDTVVSNGFWKSDLLIQHKNGKAFWILMNITAVLDEHQQRSHYVGFCLDMTLQKQAEKVLLDDRKRLEKQVEKSVHDLNRLKEEGSEINTALKVMIKLRESESAEAKNQLILELKQEVMPFLQRLKHSSHDTKQVRLLNVLDANLQRLIASYGCVSSMSSAYKHLTPKEVQVASMVRDGASTKLIAATLSLSPETISIHRKNIRKKLGLESKSNNLRTYLATLDR